MSPKTLLLIPSGIACLVLLTTEIRSDSIEKHPRESTIQDPIHSLELDSNPKEQTYNYSLDRNPGRQEGDNYHRKTRSADHYGMVSSHAH